MTRKCNTCHVFKPINDFHKNKYRCKPCQSVYAKAYREANREKINASRRYRRNNGLNNEKEYNRQWAKENIEKVRQYSRKHYHESNGKERSKQYIKDHPEVAQKKWKNYYDKNREKLLEYKKEYKRKNPKLAQKTWMDTKIKRKRLKEENGFFQITQKEFNRIRNSPCAWCGTQENITVDHIIPLDRGGRHSIGNLQPLCLSCNSSKNKKLMIEWKQYKMNISKVV